MPLVSDAKGLTSYPSRTLNAASCWAGSGTGAGHSATAFSKDADAQNGGQGSEGRMERSGFIEPPCGRCLRFPDLFVRLLDQRNKLFHLRGEPADVSVAVIATAGLLGPVSGEEGPVHGARVVEPKTITDDDGLTNRFQVGNDEPSPGIGFGSGADYGPDEVLQPPPARHGASRHPARRRVEGRGRDVSPGSQGFECRRRGLKSRRVDQGGWDTGGRNRGHQDLTGVTAFTSSSRSA